MAQVEVPALTRAHLLQWKGTIALKFGDFDGWVSLTSEAEALFQAEGHQLEPLFIELERLHYNLRVNLPCGELKLATMRIKNTFAELGW